MDFTLEFIMVGIISPFQSKFFFYYLSNFVTSLYHVHRTPPSLQKKKRNLNFIFSQHGPEAMMAIAFTRRPSVRPSLASTIVEVFETIIATGLKSYGHV